MSTGSKQKTKQSSWQDWLILAVVLLIGTVLLSLFPGHRQPAFAATRRFSVDMFTILPAVMILMGLFSVWVPRETVVKYLGKSAGIKGMTLALFFGALPTGPLYIAFPLAAGLLGKGARVSNIVIFLTAWACIKLPQEMVELQFLGARFMIARLGLTILAAIFMGLIVERVVQTAETRRSH